MATSCGQFRLEFKMADDSSKCLHSFQNNKKSLCFKHLFRPKFRNRVIL